LRILAIIAFNFFILAFSQMSVAAPQDFQLKQILNDSSVSCEGLCPEAVGHLLSWGPSLDPQSKDRIRVLNCTGFLAAGDIVGTESHCIPQEVVENPALCTERVGIKFPAVGGHPMETLTCTQLIQASDLPPEIRNADYVNLDHQDFAFFRVERSTRAPLTISRSGIKNHTPLRFFVAKEIGKNHTAMIRTEICLTEQRSVYTEYLHDFSPFVMSFGDQCNIERGDSGAPGVDESGKVVSLLHVFVDRAQGLAKYADQYGMQLQNQKPWFNTVYSQNFACLDLPAEVDHMPRPPECAKLSELNQAALNARAAKANSFQHADELQDRQAFESQAPLVFRLKELSTREGKSDKYSFELDCLIPKESWSKLARVPSVQNNFVGVKFYEQSTAYQFFIDASYHLKTIKTMDDKRYNEISIDLSLVGAADSVVGTRTVNGVKTPFSTHWCSGPELVSR
jgi:hypothetical protein